MSLSDEPACGSLRHIVPNHSPENSRAAKTSRCRAVPCAISSPALPCVSIAYPPIAMQACEMNALAAFSTVQGSCMPPISASCDAAIMPVSA